MKVHAILHCISICGYQEKYHKDDTVEKERQIICNIGVLWTSQLFFIFDLSNIISCLQCVNQSKVQILMEFRI